MIDLGISRDTSATAQLRPPDPFQVKPELPRCIWLTCCHVVLATLLST
jgi:hypothetical protein